MSMFEVKNEKGWALFRGFFTRASVPHSSFWVRWLVGTLIAIGMFSAGFLSLAGVGFVAYLLFEVLAIHPAIVFTTAVVLSFGALIASFKP